MGVRKRQTYLIKDRQTNRKKADRLTLRTQADRQIKTDIFIHTGK